MEEIVLISSMAMLIILAAFLSIVLGKLRMPPLIGFLTAGIVIANITTLSEDAETILDIFSNLGLIMLMFSIGMEIDIRKLRSQGRFALIVSCVQLPLMVAGGLIAGTLLGFTFLQSITLGAIISGSSTAVVLAVLNAQGKMDKEHIEMLVLITIMEDIGQVIMLSMLTPMLSGSEMSGDALIILILGIAIFMISCFTLGLFIVPRIIDWFYERSNDELISLLCIGALFTLSWAAHSMGLSVAIGAFLMGVIVGTSRPKEAVEHFVEPMKTMFMAMFFISVGMEVALDSLRENIVLILIFYGVFAACKSFTVYLGYWIGNGDARCGFASALGLCAMGEFAFIISKQALDCGVVDQSFYSSVIGAALISMIMLPLLTGRSDKVFDSIEKHQPNFLRRFIERLNGARDRTYGVLGSVSSMTHSAFAKGLGNTYINIVVVFVVQALFFLIFDPLTWWLSENIGRLTYDQWGFVVILLNFGALLMPCYVIASSLRLIMFVLKPSKNSSKFKSSFYEVMNPLTIAALLDLLILLITPNGLEKPHHIVIFLCLAILVGLTQVWKMKTGKARPAPKGLEEEKPSEE